MVSLRERLERVNQANSLTRRIAVSGSQDSAKAAPGPVAPSIQKSRRIAILSDIHANLPALAAVVEHAKSVGATSFCFLGDLLGYFGYHIETLDYIMQYSKPNGPKRICKGNHEEMVEMAADKKYTKEGIRDTFKVNDDAAEAIIQTKEQIIASPRAMEYANFISGLPDVIQIAPGIKGIHGFREFGEEGQLSLQMRYVMPEKLIEMYGITKKELCESPEKIIAHSKLFDENTFAVMTGHVHVPFWLSVSPQGHILGYWVPDRKNQKTEHKDKPGLLESISFRPGEKAIISVGSAGGISKRIEEEVMVRSRHPEKGHNPLPILPAYFVVFDEATLSTEYYETYYDYTLTEQVSRKRGMPNILGRYNEQF